MLSCSCPLSIFRSRSAERNREKRRRERERPHLQSKSVSNRTESEEKGNTAAVKEEKKPKVVTVSRVVVTKNKDKETSPKESKKGGTTEKEGIIAAVEAEQKRLEEEMQKRRERMEAWRKQRQKDEDEENEKIEEERKKAWTLEDDEDDENEEAGEDGEEEGTGGEGEEGKKMETTGEGKKMETTGEGKKMETTGEGKKMETTGEGKKMETTGEGKKMETTGEGKRMETAGVGEEEEELDPLDAFMKGINREAKNILGPGRDTGTDGKASKMTMITVTKVKGGKDKRGELMQNNQDAVEYSDEEGGDDELALALLTIARKNKKKDLPKVDHKALTYEPFRKDFYVEVPELSKMTQQDVVAYRAELGNIKVKGKNCPKPVKTWAQCGLNTKVLDVIKKSNYEKPTPIQAQAIPAIMRGRDLIGIARTGSGKTLAFLLPLFRHILDQPPLDYEDGPISLILSPTRELAQQIYTECKKFCKPLKLRVVCVYGGTGISDQIADLKRGTEIVVCTPGRMIDMLAANSGKVINMRRATYIVLDEADRMFDMGFEPQVTKIISMIRPDRQTVMFSATFPRQMEALARKILTKPIEVLVGGRSVVCNDVEQSVIKIEESNKFFKLLELLGIYQEKGGVLVFVERQASADNVVRDLMKAGYPCMALHGGMDQYDRDSTISDFKKGNTGLLVATSVAARGLDVKELNLVVNYDCPNHYEDYVHRCGRTGRAGNKGNAYTFIMPSQQRFSGEIIKALELSGASVPPDVEEMWKTYKETIKGNNIEGKMKVRKRRAIGFTGKGFKFDAKEAAKDTAAKLKQKSTLGLADSDDDDDEIALLTMDKKLDELFSGRAKLIDPNAPQMNLQKAAPPNAAASKSLAAASRIADKIMMTKNLVAGGSTYTAAQEAASSVMKGEEVSVTGAVLASQIAASINAKVGAGPAKAANAFLPVGTILPKNSSTDSSDQQPGTTQDSMRYEEEIEINGFPQQIRFRITTREVLDDIGEYAESYVSVRGLYVMPGNKPKEGEKKLHLKIEAKSERSITLSKQEIKRVIKEEAQRMASRVGPKRKQGRYSVV